LAIGLWPLAFGNSWLTANSYLPLAIGLWQQQPTANSQQLIAKSQQSLSDKQGIRIINLVYFSQIINL
jgi:hypothetical protein